MSELICWPAGHEVAYTIVEYLIFMFSMFFLGMGGGWQIYKEVLKRRERKVNEKNE